MSSSKFENYYLGLDIGTDSIGWCVTDPDYNVLKYKGKAMWGIRLFDEASSAESRRMFRTGRRRLARRRRRITILQELLAEKIAKVDPIFFLRLNESFYQEKDKNEEVRQPYSIFADNDYNDVDYHREFPTIYHLRYALMSHKKKYDVRLYYLAIAHFMKHRGHFLFSGDFDNATSFENVFDDLNSYLDDNYGFAISPTDLTEFKNILVDRSLGKSEKKRRLIALVDDINDQGKEILTSISGGTFNLEKLFDDESLKEAEITKLSFADGVDDEKTDKLSTMLGEGFDLILKLKSVYDWSVLSNILSGYKSISEACIGSYNKHKEDLKKLKKLIRKYNPAKYKEVFSDPTIKENYVSYSGHVSGKNDVLLKDRAYDQRSFCDYLRKKVLNSIMDTEDPELMAVLSELELCTFMPRQVMKSNSAIPHQVNYRDLEIIVNNLGIDYPEYAEKGEDGYSVCEKILMTFKFRIPYYVGPLNPYHSNKGGNSWVKRLKEGSVYPWNFDQMVDTKASAEAFIRRLTNKCTYLSGEDVIPRDSLLYSKFLVLNELNNVRINGERLTPEIKQRIFNELFKKKVTKLSLKKLKEWLRKENYIEDDSTSLSGIDDTFKSSLKSYIDFYRIIGDRVETEVIMVEDIIKNIVIFGEDKKLLKERLTERYSDKLSKEEIKNIVKLKYTGWGRFSEKLLNRILDASHETGELITIIQAMWEGAENFMELMSSNHRYNDAVRGANAEFNGTTTDINYALVADSYASPAVKRAIWQTLRVVKEIRRFAGFDPTRVFLEVARNKEDKPDRKKSRKNNLIQLYNSIKDDSRDWIKEIDAFEERKFSSKKLYLYYTQMGRDMYSGKPIDLDELFNSNTYDIDHIYPQSKVTDDSLQNNLVLVKSELNRDKSDTYPISYKYRQEELWKSLYEKGLITKEKYNRLTRKQGFSEEELAGFISRQLVETRQTTKVVSDILEQTMPESKIVYSKAGVVSKFRQENGFYKSRAVNDYHHAKDAYLNIVVGNVYYTKFTANPINFIKKELKGDAENGKYNLNHMFDFDIVRNGITAWKRGKEGSIATVKKYMSKNNILFTRYATEKRGGLFDQNILKKGAGNLLPIKSTDPRYGISKYGGYNKPGINHFMLVESEKKGQKIRTLEGVPVYLADADVTTLVHFCEEQLGLVKPDIRISKIRINSLLKINGYPMHISGKSGNQIIMKNAVQLCVSEKEEKIIGKLEKVYERIKVNKEYQVSEYDGITENDLVSIYDSLYQKFVNGIFTKRPACQRETLKSGREPFSQLDIELKSKTIYEILHLYQCKPFTADLCTIGGSKNAGLCLINKCITKSSTATLINQSATGLFEQEIDLLTV